MPFAFSTLACFFLRFFLRELVSCEKYLDDLVAGVVVKFTVHIPIGSMQKV